MFILLLLLVALLGLFLTALGFPGTWLFLFAAVMAKLLAWTPGLTWLMVGIGTALAILGEVIEWVASVRWTERHGGSRRAGWGALVGGIVGAVVGIPVPVIGSILGSFAGSFLGALVAEYSATRNHPLAGQVAWGALIGRVVATGSKVGIGVVVTVIVLVSAWG